MSPGLLTYWLHVEVSTTLSLGSINLLELLTEPRETCLLISLQLFAAEV